MVEMILASAPDSFFFPIDIEFNICMSAVHSTNPPLFAHVSSNP
jgi:hypothetical protein